MAPRTALFALLALALAGCYERGAQTEGEVNQHLGVRQVEIVARDYEFAPDLITAQPGEALRIQVVNAGNHDHSFVIGGGKSGRHELHRILQPGESGTMEFVMPDDTAYVEFHCPIGRHGSRGMTGRIAVPESR